MNEDYLFNFQVMLVAESVEICKKTLYLYDFREGSLSKRYIEHMPERKRNLFQVYKEELMRHQLFERYQAAYYARCVDGFYACITNECSGWSLPQNGSAVQRVAEILNLPECRIALKRCSREKMKAKGKIIYWLM